MTETILLRRIVCSQVRGIVELPTTNEGPSTTMATPYYHKGDYFLEAELVAGIIFSIIAFSIIICGVCWVIKCLACNAGNAREEKEKDRLLCKPKSLITLSPRLMKAHKIELEEISSAAVSTSVLDLPYEPSNADH